MKEKACILACGQSSALGSIPVTGIDKLRKEVVEKVERGARLSALTAYGNPSGTPVLLAALSHPSTGKLEILRAETGTSYRSLTPECPSAHLFERLILEKWGIVPDGHPMPEPVRYPAGNPGTATFLSIPGGITHEVAVGPVHAGVIEPGHFRFQCHGETVKHLDISLGYQHRGIEDMITASPPNRVLHYMETAAGDTTAAHTIAHCLARESLSGTTVPARGESLRGIALELERLANHIGDIGAISGDVGFLPTKDYCGRIRGDVLNLTAVLCGNRFGRGLIVPGGTASEATGDDISEISSRLRLIERDTTNAIELMLGTPSVITRLEGTGTVTGDTAVKLGLVGVAARGSGVATDVRNEFPFGIYRFAQIPVCTWASGDCFARTCVRWLEVRQSFRFLREQLDSLPGGPERNHELPMQPDMVTVALTEGWRGEVCHIAATDRSGDLAWYRIFDPSVHNWHGLAMAMREEEISDFPLCNKSFNLSYCGHDL